MLFFTHLLNELVKLEVEGRATSIIVTLTTLSVWT